MAEIGGSTNTMDALLRTVYLRDMRRQYSLKSVLLQAFRRRFKVLAEGERISIPIHMAAGEGHTWTNDDDLPEAASERVERAYFNYAMMTNRIKVRQSFLDAANSGQASELDPLRFQMKSLIANQRHDLSFDLYGDGSGQVGTVASASSGTAFTLDAITGVRNNLRVDILLTGSGAVGGGVAGARIALNRGTGVCTILDGKAFSDGTGATVNGDASSYAVYRAGAYNKAAFGLAAAVNDGNPSTGILYGAVDRSDDLNDAYRSIVHGNSGTGRQPTLKMVQDVLDDIEKAGGSEGNINLIIAPHDIWSWFAEHLVDDKRYNGQLMKLNGWAQAVNFGTVPIVRDKHCPAGTMFFLDTDTFRIYQDGEGQWMGGDGSILSRYNNKVAYQAGWYRRLQTICLVPGANGRLDDLQYAAP